MIRNHFFKLIKFFIGWPLSLIALFFIGNYIFRNISQVIISLVHIHISLVLMSIFFFLCYFFLRCFFWKELLRHKLIIVSLRDCLYFWAISELQRYVPGNIWSIMARTLSFSKNNISKKTILSLFAIEALYIVIASFITSFLTINFLIYGLLRTIPNKEVFIFSYITLILIVSFCLIFPFLLKKIHLHKIYNTLVTQPTNSLSLLVIMLAALLCYGLGYYFSVSALVLLYPQHMINLVGFFVFALLIGYLSIITPMGLGVREAVITAGLSKYVASSLAATGAVLARLLFMFAEMLFVIFVMVLYRQSYPFINKMFLSVQKYAHMQAVYFLAICYSIYFTVASFLRYDNFYTGRFDLGNMDQTVWNTMHGRVFQLTDPNGTDIVSRLIFHADFILVLLSPFYYIWQSPKMLLLVQTLILASGGIVIFLLAKTITKNKLLALIFSFAYFINPSVNYTNLFDFHGVALATTFLLAGWYFMVKKQYLITSLFLALAGLTKEEIWIIDGLIGIYIFFFQKKYWYGLVITVLSFLTCYLFVFVAIPHVRGGQHFALSFYSDFGDSPSKIIKAFFINPVKIYTTLLTRDRITYFIQLFTPIGFLSFLSPLFLLFALPDLLLNLLSNSKPFHQIYYHYASEITPFLFIAAIYGAKRMQQLVQSNWIAFYIFCSALLCAYFYGPLFGSTNPNITMFTQQVTNRQVIENFLTHIPQRYSIAATNNLGSHLSHRQQIYTIPIGIEKADVILFLLNDPFAQPSLLAQKKMVLDMEKDKTYTEVFVSGDFVAFEKTALYNQKNIYHKRKERVAFPFLFYALRFFSNFIHHS